MLSRSHTSPSQGFTVLPAIDLVDGMVVRLRKGDFATATRYSDDPVETAQGFAALGATWIHVVDLDGARQGNPVQLDIVARVAAVVGNATRVEVGGGLRTPEAVDAALAAGVARVALGTAALRNPAFARAVVDRHGADRLVCSIDIREGQAVGDGWRAGAVGVPVKDAVGALADAGVETFEVTAIDRDGLLGGPDLGLLERLIAMDRGQIIASGGIATIAHVVAAREIGCAGAIIGRALYEGGIDLADLLAALRP